MTPLLRRWNLYLWAMFNPASRLFFALLVCAAVQWPARALHGLTPMALDGPFLVGTAGYFLIMLYYRLCDEFKDYATDQTHFPDRPVPAGQVSLEDLRRLTWLVVAALFALNLLWPGALVAFLALFLFAFLMGKWFYLPGLIADNRLLAFITHAPVSLFGHFYLLALVAAALGAELLTPDHWWIVLWVTLPGYLWEVARKTRAPEEERPGYQTYSVMLGHRACIAITLTFLALHLVVGWQLSQRLALPEWPRWWLAVCALGMAVVLLDFLRQPRSSAWLRPTSEVYGALSLGGVLVAMA